MKMSFKQFSVIIDLPEDQLTEEKLDEIFGLDKFLDAAKKIMDPKKREAEIERLEKERIAAHSAAFTKRKELKATQDQKKAIVAKQVSKSSPRAYDANPVVGARASGMKAAERDWANEL
jgi:hypothetical protein